MQLASYGGVAGSDRDRVVLDGHANKDPLPTFQLDLEGENRPGCRAGPVGKRPDRLDRGRAGHKPRDIVRQVIAKQFKRTGGIGPLPRE